MNYKISKELFEAVYNEDLLRIEVGTCSVVAYLTDGTEFTENIDTFFFDCKEWALKQGYKLQSSPIGIEYVCVFNSNGLTGNHFENFRADAEQQAVFDACMYILDKDKQ